MSRAEHAPPLQLLRRGALCVLLAAGCHGEQPLSSPGIAPSITSTASSPGLGPSTDPTVAASQEPTAPVVPPADPVAALTGRATEALGPGGVDVVLRIGADGFQLPEGEVLIDLHGDRVLGAREGIDGRDAILVVRDLDGNLVREIATGIDIPQTGIVRGEDVYFGGIDLGADPSDLELAEDRGVWLAAGDAPPQPVLPAEAGVVAVYTAIERSPDGRTIGVWRCGTICSTILVRPDGGTTTIPKPGLIALTDDVALLIGAFKNVTAHAVDDGAVLWRAETEGVYYGRYATSDGERIVLSAMDDANLGDSTDQLRIELLDARTGDVVQSVVVPTDEPLLLVARTLSTDRYVAILESILPNPDDGPHEVQVVDLEAGVLLDQRLLLGGIR